MRLSAAFPALALLGALGAQDPTPPQAPADPAQAERATDPAARIEEIVSSYEKATKEWSDSYRKASEEERKQLGGSYPDRMKPVDEVLVLLEANPDAPDLLRGVRFALVGSGQQRARLHAFVLAHRMDKPDELLQTVQGISNYSWSAAGEALLRKILARGGEGEDEVRARFHLAQCLNGMMRTSESLAGDPSKLENLNRYYDAGTVEAIRALDRSKAAAEVETLLEDVAERGKDISFRGKSYAAAAEGVLFEVQRLQVGMVAPEIEGTGIRGGDLKLSGFRGKVVLLDFWGDW